MVPARCLHLSAVILAIALSALPARAQDGNPPPAAPPPDSTVVPDLPVTPPPAARRSKPVPPLPAEYDTSLTLPLLVDIRPRAEINLDLTRSAELKAAALERLSVERAYEVRRKSQVEIKKTEVLSMKIRIDLAKKEKRAADQKALEAERRRLESQQRYLDRLREMHGAQAAVQQALADFAQSRSDAARLELKLHDLGDLSNAGTRAAVESRNAQARVLSAIKNRADKNSSLASAERSAADKSKAVLDAWVEMTR